MFDVLLKEITSWYFKTMCIANKRFNPLLNMDRLKNVNNYFRKCTKQSDWFCQHYGSGHGMCATTTTKTVWHVRLDYHLEWPKMYNNGNAVPEHVRVIMGLLDNCLLHCYSVVDLKGSFHFV